MKISRGSDSKFKCKMLPVQDVCVCVCETFRRHLRENDAINLFPLSCADNFDCVSECEAEGRAQHVSASAALRHAIRTRKEMIVHLCTRTL